MKRKKSFLFAEALIQFTVFCFLVFSGASFGDQKRPQTSVPKTSAASRMEAKTNFETACASCHGLDARGGERGPDIVSRPDVVRKTDAQLVKILTEGKPAAGMPSFATYGRAKLSALVGYLRTLQGRSGTPLPGDPARGKTLFFGKANCAECHNISGQGGFFGQDLTSYAARMDAVEIRTAIINPDKDLDPRHGLVTVILDGSTTLSGVPRNEDNFSLQLQTPDGAFHLLNKSAIKGLTYTGKSPMPSNYGSTLSSQELNDLVSYLLVTSQSVSAGKVQSGPGDNSEE